MSKLKISNKTNKNKKRYYPTTKLVLTLAGLGAFIVGSLIFPGLPVILRGRELDLTNFLAEDEWDKFDESRLRQKLKQLRKQKVIKIYKVGGKYAVQITEKGRRRLIKYKLDEIEIPKPDKWDKRWRIVTWDIPKEQKRAGDSLRITLKRLGFLKLNKSVYLFPYPCTDAIDYIRELYGVGEHVTLLTVGYLEGEQAYKEYFDL